MGLAAANNEELLNPWNSGDANNPTEEHVAYGRNFGITGSLANDHRIVNLNAYGDDETASASISFYPVISY